MQDILPPDIYIWQKVEADRQGDFFLLRVSGSPDPGRRSRRIFSPGASVKTPTSLKRRCIRSRTRAGGAFLCRPEGTASVVRCYVEKQLCIPCLPRRNSIIPARCSDMKGRSRAASGSFIRSGSRPLAAPGPRIDAEVISMLRHFLERLGLKELNFQVNSIGCAKCRPVYREELLDFFAGGLDRLCPDCSRRYHTKSL